MTVAGGFSDLIVIISSILSRASVGTMSVTNIVPMGDTRIGTQIVPSIGALSSTCIRTMLGACIVGTKLASAIATAILSIPSMRSTCINTMLVYCFPTMFSGFAKSSLLGSFARLRQALFARFS